MKRRDFLCGTLALAASSQSLTARATPDEVSALIRQLAGGRNVRTSGITLDIPQLVENGNLVPVTVRVASAMTGNDRVRSIHLFAEKNPLPEVAAFHFGPRAGSAVASTRIRLADTQHVHALALMDDGSVRMTAIEVIVTLAACTETA